LFIDNGVAFCPELVKQNLFKDKNCFQALLGQVLQRAAPVFRLCLSNSIICLFPYIIIFKKVKCLPSSFLSERFLFLEIYKSNLIRLIFLKRWQAVLG